MLSRDFKHLLIVSHRRSGTHLTIDLIRNNFIKFGNPYISLYQLHKRRLNKKYLTNIFNRLNLKSRILKSHSTISMSDFYTDCSSLVDIGLDLVKNNKIIYVYRDGRDVMVSQYYHEELNEKIHFSEYIRMKNEYYDHAYAGNMSKLEYWAYHVEQWINFKQDNIFIVRYEDILNDYTTVVKTISAFLGTEMPPKIVDVRISKCIDEIPQTRNHATSTKGPTVFTTVNYRNGNIGDFKKYFTNQDLVYFNSVIGKTNTLRLAYKAK